jgi:S-adenosyl methyltransferase
VQTVYNSTQTPLTLRSLTGIKHFFDGFKIAEPGIVNVANWQNKADASTPLRIYGGVAKMTGQAG